MLDINQLLASKVASRERAKAIAAQRADLLVEQQAAKEAASLSSDEKVQIASELLNKDHPFIYGHYIYGSNGLGLPDGLTAAAGVVDVSYIRLDTTTGRAYLEALGQFKAAMLELSEAKAAYIRHLVESGQGHLLNVNIGKLARRLADSGELDAEQLP
jgi:uncharacterized membrane protein